MSRPILYLASDMSNIHDGRLVMLAVGSWPRMFGVIVEPWGIRLMLVEWHVCWHWPVWRKDGGS